jgi:putative ABC transport system permease protein
MNPFTRGIRNAFRNSIRTFSIVVILGLSVGLALTMLVARQAVDDKIQSVKTSIGNTVSISPAGVLGFQGGGEPLTVDQLSKVKALDHVTSVTQSLNDRLTSENSDLESAIEAGTLGNRQAGNSGIVFQAPPQHMGGGTSEVEVTRTFTPPVMVTGTDNVSAAATYGGDTVTFSSGAAFDPTKDENVAVVGKALAEKNSLSVGSTFKAYNTDIKVVGIYDTGNTFANGGLLLPLSSLQRLSGQPNAVTSATAIVDSVDNIDTVVSAIKAALGDKADVTNNQENAKQTIEPLENVKSISTFSLIGALVAGAVIILLTMMMIVRERRREIGVMKAIGSSNLKTMLQFISESVTLTVLGLVVGLVIGVAAASPVTKVLVNNSTSSSQQAPDIRGQGGPRPGAVFRSFGNDSLANARNIQASVGWDILGYGVGAAVLIAVIGSALPAYFISRVRPSEVMRAD